jgi:hypothetical protein
MTTTKTRREREAAKRLRLAGKILDRLEREGFGRNYNASTRAIRAHLSAANADLLQREEDGQIIYVESDRFWQTVDRAIRLGAIEGHWQGLSRIIGHAREVKL